MPENKRRFVTLCQQLLAVGTVAALAAPSAGIVSLEIVAPAPAPVENQGAAAPTEAALVASGPVEPEVTETPIRGVEKAGLQALTRSEAAQRKAKDRLAALSSPVEVEGLATVGVTWSPKERLADGDVSVSVRSLQDGQWGEWQTVEYDADHGPDPDSEEARNARQGTDPIVVGAVDEVQVKIETADGDAPADARLSVVDPRPTPEPTLSEPAIDTADLSDEGAAALSSSTTDPTGPGEEPTTPTEETPDGSGVLAGAVVTPKPKIFSRAQWGADERLRNKSALSYYEIHAGFVHHTVNANGYTKEQVPSLLRGIYAYHTQSRGWSDIGYNFVVDRFGRIWEGRYGGVDRPVVGAHTLGYNEYSFAMSALGNFDTVEPSPAMLRAYGRLFGWKLSLHGVSASSTRQWVGKRYFPAVNGHRDAGSTACPGRYLYAKLPRIRTLATDYQQPFSDRDRKADLAGSVWPDLVVRDKATKRLHMVRTGGQTNFTQRARTSLRWAAMDLIATPGDLTGDGIPDLVARNKNTKVTGVHPGTSSGGFRARIRDISRLSAADQMVGVPDLDGDGVNDLVVRIGWSQKLFLYRGNGRGGLLRKRIRLSGDWSAYDRTVGAGDFNGDGRNDLLARSGDRLFLVPGRGTALAAPKALPGKWGAFSQIAAGRDLTKNGNPDILVQARSSKNVFVYPGNGKGGLEPRLGAFSQFAGMNYLAPVGHMTGDDSVDLVGRNAHGRVFVYTHNGYRNVEAVTDTGIAAGRANLVLNVGDWNGDGYGDIMTRSAKTGALYLRTGDGRGRFASAVFAAKGFGGVTLLASVGDITGDGNPDLMGQPSGKAMRIYPGNGGTGFKASYVARSAISANAHTGIGLWDGDGSPDSMFRRSDGSLVLHRGNGPGGLLGGSKVADGLQKYDWVRAVGDATGDGHPDLLARQSSNGRLVVFPGKKTRAGFWAPRLVAVGFGKYDLTS
ncbi:MAG TPA: FG-GAP-like repeat-containing protein [Nocardioidaceae bacterium]